MIKGFWRASYSEIFSYFLLEVPGFNAPQRIVKAYGSRLRAFCSLPISLFNRGRADVLFCGGRFADLIRVVDMHRSVKVLGGGKELYFSLLGRFGYFCSWGLSYRAYKIFLSKDELALEELVGRCERLLRQWGIKAVVVMSDSLPLERVWILAARRVGVRSICIQHGLFSESGGVINDGKYADVMAAYDQCQVDILKRTGALNPVVFGFYGDVKSRVWREQRSVVCILGQPLPQYYEDKGDVYKSLLSSLVSILSLGGIHIVYKPHPGEAGVRDYIDGGVELTDLSLDAVFDEYDIFLSFTSTALFEASLAGKLAIQIFDERLSSERFSEMGYAHTLQSNSLDSQLLELIRMGSPFMPFSDSRTVAQRFLALMEDHCL
ncbi:hypothetical protein OEG79_12685 [Pseudomonas sp. Z8(2022)]|uniref:hypothetical protein n=1 Tax=Pseudomonas sp. Z8(2022) TaxID=2962597 RepID=UPI0021F3D8CA|nr:hypothetical protein [Pseudomonas sp. Z8(2022)]UYP28924.1 hypothetical protein OEG79_12685 [Pseudomonas sp. Z8(2022)]